MAFTPVLVGCGLRAISSHARGNKPYSAESGVRTVSLDHSIGGLLDHVHGGVGRRIHLSPALLSRIAPIVLLLLFPFVAASHTVDARYMWYLVGSHILILLIGALLCHTALAARRPD